MVFVILKRVSFVGYLFLCYKVITIGKKGMQLIEVLSQYTKYALNMLFVVNE